MGENDLDHANLASGPVPFKVQVAYVLVKRWGLDTDAGTLIRSRAAGVVDLAGTSRSVVPTVSAHPTGVSCTERYPGFPGSRSEG